MKITTSKCGAFYYVDPGPKYNRKTHTLLLSIPGKRFWTGKEPKDKADPVKVWKVEVSAMTTQFISMAFPDANWNGKRKSEMETDFLLHDPFKKIGTKITGYKPQTKPFPHQAKGFMGSKDLEAFAWFMEQRTGKTWLAINNAAYLFERGIIDAFVVITLNGVCDTWLEEFDLHWPSRIPVSIHRFRAQYSDSYEEWLRGVQDEFPILIVNVEGLAHERISELIDRFYSKYESIMTVVDESTSIKNHTSARAKVVHSFGKQSSVRRIMTGTPITQDLRDLYSQFYFLSPDIIGYGSFYHFEYHFVEKNGYEVLFFKHQDQLQAAVTPYIYRVLRKEVFKDLPEEVRQTFRVQMSKKMQRVYDDIETKLLAEFEGQEIRTPLAINRILRLSQVVGGFFPYVEDKSTKYLPIERKPQDNPKIQMMLDIIEGEGKKDKVVVWARFRAELDLIVQVLKKKYGEESVREIHGGIRTPQRTKNRLAFQDDESEVRFLVNQLDAGGIGIDLDKTALMIYYSNSYRLESRLQSEARPMSARQRKAVGIYDIVMENTVDELVLIALAMKKSFADILDKENFESWLRME